MATEQTLLEVLKELVNLMGVPATLTAIFAYFIFKHNKNVESTDNYVTKDQLKLHLLELKQEILNDKDT